MTAPACPLCGRDLVPSKRLTGYWECPDGTCSGLLREADGLPAWDEVLGSSIPDLMQASATSKKGGSSGGSRGRQKPRKVTAYRRERRYLDQAPAGGRDRVAVCERRQKKLRLSSDLEAWLDQASKRSGMPQQGIIEALLWAAMEAPWCAVCDLPGLPGGGCIGGCRPEA